MSRPLPALALALLLVVAGCAAPTAPPTATTPGETDDGQPSTPASPTTTRTDAETPTDTAEESDRFDEPDSPEELAASYDIAVEGGELPVDPALVYARIVLLLDADVVQPESVVIEPDSRMAIGGGAPPRFHQLLGLTRPEGANRTLTAAGYVAGVDVIHINERITDNGTTVESVLAHESVHIAQFQQGQGRTVRQRVFQVGGVSVDQRLTYTAVIEGTATYTQAEYQERYMPDRGDPATTFRRSYRRADGAAKLGYAPYAFGSTHVERRVDDPANLSIVYERPPRTTEEVLHGRANTSHPRANLSVSATTGGNWTGPNARQTYGELFTRVVLATELNESAAAAGADGWGMDVRVAFDHPEHSPGYAWVLRFDDPANATEFERTFGAYLDDRGERRTGRWVLTDTDVETAVRLERVGEETVVVVLGPPEFVSATSVAGSSGNVSVAVGT